MRDRAGGMVDPVRGLGMRDRAGGMVDPVRGLGMRDRAGCMVDLSGAGNEGQGWRYGRPCQGARYEGQGWRYGRFDLQMRRPPCDVHSMESHDPR